MLCLFIIIFFGSLNWWSLTQDQIPNELASGKVFLQGRDTQGRAVFVVLAKQQEKGRPEETKRCICYTLDNAIAACDPLQNELGQFVCLFDLSGECPWRSIYLPIYLLKVMLVRLKGPAWNV